MWIIKGSGLFRVTRRGETEIVLDTCVGRGPWITNHPLRIISVIYFLPIPPWSGRKTHFLYTQHAHTSPTRAFLQNTSKFILWQILFATWPLHLCWCVLYLSQLDLESNKSLLQRKKRQLHQLGCLISCDCCFQEKPRQTCIENESNKGRSMYAWGNYPVLSAPKRGAFWQPSKIANTTMTHFTTKQRLLRTETSSLPDIFFMTRNLFSKRISTCIWKEHCQVSEQTHSICPTGTIIHQELDLTQDWAKSATVWKILWKIFAPWHTLHSPSRAEALSRYGLPESRQNNNKNIQPLKSH